MVEAPRERQHQASAALQASNALIRPLVTVPVLQVHCHAKVRPLRRRIQLVELALVTPAVQAPRECRLACPEDLMGAPLLAGKLLLSDFFYLLKKK
jgi:hypothetical protein